MKKIIAICLVVLVLFGTMSPTVIQAQETLVHEVSVTVNKDNQVIVNELTEYQRKFLKKYELLLSKFRFSNGNSGKLILSVTRDALISEYGFTSEEANDIFNAIKFSYLPKTSNLYHARIHVNAGKIYFTNDDVIGFLSTAAQIGPAAIYGALVGLGTISLGPVGTTLVSALGIIGAPGLAGFTYQVLQAVVNRQGVFIGIEFNGTFPIIVSGTW